ncbi:hypothetical protein [Polynucleobacter asymbioticus]|nr:hypothetical protein [Polynucleobacter asymbioticus]
MWMNPGYMILTGSIYKIFGYSFALSREISWAFYLLGFLTLSITLKDIVSKISILLLATSFLLPSSLASGNLARMESMEIFFASLIFLALIYKRFWIAIAILIICALFHFNAIYISLPIIGAIALELKSARSLKILQPNKWDVLAISVSLALLALYLGFVFKNLDAFNQDMIYQFSRKFGRTPFYKIPKNIFYLFVISSTVLFAFFKNHRNLTILGLLSLSFFLTYAIGQEMWYQIFFNLSLGLISIVGLNLLPEKKFIKVLALMILIALNAYQAGSSFAGMRPAFSKNPYIDGPTTLEIEQQILSLAQGVDSNGPVTVSFMSRGVGMMFYPFLKRNDLQLRYKLPDQMNSNFPSNICVYITRSLDPDWLKIALSGPTAQACDKGLIVSEVNGDVRVFRTEKNIFTEINRQQNKP